MSEATPPLPDWTVTKSAGFAVWWEHKNTSRGSSLKWYLINLPTNILLYTSLLSKACDNILSTAFDYSIEVILSEHKGPGLYWCKEKDTYRSLCCVTQDRA